MERVLFQEHIQNDGYFSPYFLAIPPHLTFPIKYPAQATRYRACSGVSDVRCTYHEVNVFKIYTYLLSLFPFHIPLKPNISNSKIHRINPKKQRSRNQKINCGRSMDARIEIKTVSGINCDQPAYRQRHQRRAHIIANKLF